MKILLIAYEFPPSHSPQSLRWAYLARSLAIRGHQLDVLTAHLGQDPTGLPGLPDSIRIHRTFAGPLRGSLAAARDSRHRPIGENTASKGTWMQSASSRIQATAATLLFPDIRGEWLRWGKRKLGELLDTIAPDVVISSHEPATTLELGLMAQARGCHWIADLGDPVPAPYTPRRWKDRAFELEARVCRQADHLLLTTHNTAELLKSRHGRMRGMTIIPQGFLAREATSPLPPVEMDSDLLELLYTGRFYEFRRPDALLDAIANVPGVRLNVASVAPPDKLIRFSERYPDRVRLLGFLAHRDALGIQRRANVLVNIANADPTQIPGKAFEYLGSQRPILHLGGDGDAVGSLLKERKRGWTIANDKASIESWLLWALAAKHSGRLDSGLNLDIDSVAEYDWDALAERVEHIAMEFLIPR